MPETTRHSSLPVLCHPLACDMQDAVLHPPQATPAHYECSRLTTISGALGAEIVDVNLASLSDTVFHEIERAIGDHLVLAFRNQELEPVDQIAFARRFGTVEPWPYARPMDSPHPSPPEAMSCFSALDASEDHAERGDDGFMA